MHMKYFRILFVSSCLLFSINLVGQSSSSIKLPNPKVQKLCNSFAKKWTERPAEIGIGFYAGKEGELYFYCTDEKWLKETLSNAVYRIAADLVVADDFACGKEVDDSKAYKGKILGMYNLPQLYKFKQKSEPGTFLARVGNIPGSYKSKDFEINLIAAFNTYLSYYLSYIDIPNYRWQLLDMPFYMSKPVKAADYVVDKSNTEAKILDEIKKDTISFSLPYAMEEKYDKTLIDSLYQINGLDSYHIHSITVSVETDISIEEKKAERMELNKAQDLIRYISKLNGVEFENIEIKVLQNFEAFKNAVKSTDHDYLSKVSKEAIIARLKDETVLNELRGVLREIRSTTVSVKVSSKDDRPDYLFAEDKSEFSNYLEQNNVEEALKLQGNIFEKIKQKTYPASYSAQLEIPKKAEFSLLANNQAVFNYFMQIKDGQYVENELKELVDLDPDNMELKYNLAVAQLINGLAKKDSSKLDRLNNDIASISASSVPSQMKQRLQLNYNLVMAELYMAHKNYSAKDSVLSTIYDTYTAVKMENKDVLSFAQFLTSYSSYDKAIGLIESRINASTKPDEELLYYYLNLRLFDDDFMASNKGLELIDKAMSVNKSRFCTLFESTKNGGASFQLKTEAGLGDAFCSKCQSNL